MFRFIVMSTLFAVGFCDHEQKQNCPASNLLVNGHLHIAGPMLNKNGSPAVEYVSGVSGPLVVLEDAFSGSGEGGCTNLTSVSMPTVTEIKARAFQQTTSLVAVYMPAVTTVGDSAFEGCSALPALYMPSVTSFDVRSFFDCPKLASIFMPIVSVSHGGVPTNLSPGGMIYLSDTEFNLWENYDLFEDFSSMPVYPISSCCPAVPYGTCSTCLEDTCIAVTCENGYSNFDGYATDGCEACPAVPHGTCDACSDEATCIAVTCDPGYGNFDSDATNGCETVCAVVPDGTCTACTSASGCTAVSCDANKFDTNGIGADGCETGCAAVPGGTCTACTSAFVDGCTVVECEYSLRDDNGDATDGCEVDTKNTFQCNGYVTDISCGLGACVTRKSDRTAYAWGHADYGGDAVADLRHADYGGNTGDTVPIDLTNVADISCGGNACVARKHDGTAYAWGDPRYGGDILGSFTDRMVSFADRMVVHQVNFEEGSYSYLTNVADISCGGNACVARSHNGTAVAWGDGLSGGSIRCLAARGCTPLPDGVELTDVADISCGGNIYKQERLGYGSQTEMLIWKHGHACVVRKNDDTAYAWGDSMYGGDIRCTTADSTQGGCSPLPDGVDLTNVADISCGNGACVARKNDYTAVAWGNYFFGGWSVDASGNAIDLTNVADISCGGYACVARKHDGTAYAWGDSQYGGDIRCTGWCSPLPADVDLTNVADISCGDAVCVVRKHNGDAYAWGHVSYGGDIRCTSGSGCTPLPADVELTDVADISCGGYACVARKHDGTAVAWGHVSYDGDASSVELTNVADISCGGSACVARKHDKSVVVWGNPDKGGDARIPFFSDCSSSTPDHLRRAMNEHTC